MVMVMVGSRFPAFSRILQSLFYSGYMAIRGYQLILKLFSQLDWTFCISTFFDQLTYSICSDGFGLIYEPRPK